MKKAVIVDFDGTFVSINSFEFFYKELAISALKEKDIDLFAFLFKQITLRKLRLIKHCELKKRTLHYFFENELNSFVPTFVNKLHEFVNESVLSICKDYKKNGYAVHLCTAAPELYVKPFVDSFDVKFDDVICTPNPHEDCEWKENLLERKKETTMELLSQRDEQLSVLITDHHNDLPLLSVTKEKNLLVNPSSETISILKDNQIPFEEYGR